VRRRPRAAPGARAGAGDCDRRERLNVRWRGSGCSARHTMPIQCNAQLLRAASFGRGECTLVVGITVRVFDAWVGSVIEKGGECGASVGTAWFLEAGKYVCMYIVDGAIGRMGRLLLCSFTGDKVRLGVLLTRMCE